MLSAHCRFTNELSGYTLEAGVASATRVPTGRVATLDEAQQSCINLGPACHGVTSKGADHARSYLLSAGTTPVPSPTGGAAWLKLCGSATCTELEVGVWYWGTHLRSVEGLRTADGCCDACLAQPHTQCTAHTVHLPSAHG